jgi:hypothetical protein
MFMIIRARLDWITFAFIIGLLPVLSCGTSTTFVDTWKDPDAKPLAFTKVITLAIVQDETNRRIIEDQFCKNIKNPNVECVRSWTILPEDRVSDVEFAKARIAEGGFDGAITVRLVGLDEKTRHITTGYVASYATTPYYNPFWGYYSYAWPVVYQSGSTDITQSVRVETNIYSVTEERLLWSGISETLDPKSIRTMVDEIAGEAAAILRDEGLIKN